MGTVDARSPADGEQHAPTFPEDISAIESYPAPEEYLALVRFLATGFDHRGLELDDLIGIANLYLCEAAKRFDRERGIRFSTYAEPTIIGAIRHALRDTKWSVRVPRKHQIGAARINRARQQLEQELGRQPTEKEIEHSTGLAAEEVREFRKVPQSSTWYPKSLDVPVSEDGEALGDMLPAQTPDVFDRRVDEIVLHQAVAKLPPQMSEVIRLYYWGDMNQREISEKLGVSQMQVSRLLSFAIKLVRQELVRRD